MNWLPHAFEARQPANGPGVCRHCPIGENHPIHVNRPTRAGWGSQSSEAETLLRRFEEFKELQPPEGRVGFVSAGYTETPEAADRRAWASFLLGGVIGFCVGFAVAALIATATGGP